MRSSLILITALLLLSLFVHAQPQNIDKVIAHVGDEIILKSDVEVQYYQYLSGQTQLPENARCILLDKLMLEKLFVEQAQKDSLYIGEEEVDDELNKRIRYYTSMMGGEKQLEEYYGKTIFEIKSDFKEDIYKQLLAQRMEAKIYDGLTVTPSEVKQFFDSIPVDSLPYFNSEMELRQIVLYPVASETQKEVAKYLITKARQDIVNGADFCNTAYLKSQDESTAKDCGDLGFIERGQMVKAFEGAAFKLKEGEISEVVESEYGYHIIQCIERQGEKIHVRHILIQPTITTADLAICRSQVDSLLKEIKAGALTFDEAVKETSEDEQSRVSNGYLLNPNTGNTYFQADELDDKTLIFALEKLKPGDMTPVLPYTDAVGKKGYRIVMLVSESEPHRASLETDYDKIQDACKQAKQQEILNDWIKSKAASFYISIDDVYQTCSEMRKWTSKQP